MNKPPVHAPPIDYTIPKIGFFRRLLARLNSNCLYCGCEDTIYHDTPDDERPHWHIYCTDCGRRMKNLDGFSDR